MTTTDSPEAPTAGGGKSTLLVGGIALAITALLFVAFAIFNTSSPDPTGHDESVPHDHDDAGNAIPVVDGDEPHDESVPHRHAPEPNRIPLGQPHDESVPHTH
ncbi:MAG: hypothetical protein AAF561_03310 [Planctomycetota bacterium]